MRMHVAYHRIASADLVARELSPLSLSFLRQGRRPCGAFAPTQPLNAATILARHFVVRMEEDWASADARLEAMAQKEAAKIQAAATDRQTAAKNRQTAVMLDCGIFMALLAKDKQIFAEVGWSRGIKMNETITLGTDTTIFNKVHEGEQGPEVLPESNSPKYYRELSAAHRQCLLPPRFFGSQIPSEIPLQIPSVIPSGIRLRFRRKPTYRSGKRKCRGKVTLKSTIWLISLVQNHPKQTSAPMHQLPQL